MEKWEIQQKINSLNYQKDSLESEIDTLNGKKRRINLEIERKGRQEMQACDFFMDRRKVANSLRAGAQGCAVNKILDKFQSIYGVDVERSVTNELDDVITYLVKNCDEIDDDIAKIQRRISSLDYQIRELYKDLYSADSEEVM